MDKAYFTFPVGTTFHRNGIPVVLASPTVVECHPGNWRQLSDAPELDAGVADGPPELSTAAIRAAAQILGGQAALARALNVKPPTVNQWVHGERRVPAEQCPAIERATAGAVRCEDLRPDVAWDVLRMQAAPLEPVAQGSGQPAEQGVAHG